MKGQCVRNKTQPAELNRQGQCPIQLIVRITVGVLLNCLSTNMYMQLPNQVQVR
jgi:hypothetical protein